MMYLDQRRYKRSELTIEQIDFLEKLVSFAKLIQTTVYDKCKLLGINSPSGICASLVMADIIHRSDWGRHQLCAVNNLALLPSSEYWRGKCTDFSGVKYRVYSSWLDFSIDYTDELTFFEKQKYLPVLTASNLDQQIEIMSNLQDSPTSYRSNIESTIEKYGLWEFDW